MGPPPLGPAPALPLRLSRCWRRLSEPEKKISVLALPLQAAQHFIEELLIEARDASALVRALGLKQRVLAGRLRSMSQGGRWAIRAAQGRERPPWQLAKHRRFEISIIEKARKRELGIFFCSRSSVRLREGTSAAGAHAHHARQLSGALQQPELRGLGQLHGGRLPAGGRRHDPERLRLEHCAHLHTPTPGRRCSFGCRRRLGTASNLVMHVSAADNDYVASQGVWSTDFSAPESRSSGAAVGGHAGPVQHAFKGESGRTCWRTRWPSRGLGHAPPPPSILLSPQDSKNGWCLCPVPRHFESISATYAFQHHIPARHRSLPAAPPARHRSPAEPAPR